MLSHCLRKQESIFSCGKRSTSGVVSLNLFMIAWRPQRYFFIFYEFVRSSHTVLDIILMQFNPVHIFSIYSFTSYFNIILASMPRPHKPSLFLEFFKQNFIGIFPYTIHSQLYCIQASKILMESAKNCNFL